jgi:hypothetical protein
MPTLTLNPAALQLHGVVPEDLRRPHLTLEAKRALGPLLQSEGFDLTSRSVCASWRSIRGST